MSDGDAPTSDGDAPADVEPDAHDEPLAWTVESSEVAYTCPGFDVRREEVRLPDGSETDFDYLDEPASVVVLPFTAADPVESGGAAAATTDSPEMVVIEEWRQAVGRVNRGLPVGGTEPDDEDLAAAAHRELTEETGYVADGVAHLTTVEPANGIANSVLHFFVATGCEPTGEQALDGDESIRVETTTLASLREHVATSEVRDGRTTLGVLYYDAFYAK